jgi:hypothetical protein
MLWGASSELGWGTGQGNRICETRIESPLPQLGEVREGEAAFRCETVIARFPHPNPPHVGGGGMTRCCPNAIALGTGGDAERTKL